MKLIPHSEFKIVAKCLQSDAMADVAAARRGVVAADLPAAPAGYHYWGQPLKLDAKGKPTTTLCMMPLTGMSESELMDSVP